MMGEQRPRSLHTPEIKSYKERKVTDTLKDADLIYRLQVVKKHGSINDAAAAEVGCKKSALRTSIETAKAKGLTADTRVRDPLAEAKNENKRLKAEIASIHKHNDTAEAIRTRVLQLRDIAPESPEWMLSDASIEGPGTPVTIWSDWHFGETVRKSEVGGLNEFNSEIAEERAKHLVERTLGLINHHMPAGVPGVVVCLGGDMMTGEIHQELADTNDKYVLETVRQLKSVLVEALTKMADNCGQVFVPCVVGNHGRNTLKPRMKGRVFTNYEWNIYTDIQDRLRDDPRIVFEIPDETDCAFAVNGHRFLLTHGDTLGVKGGDGIIGAIGPIMRGAFKVGRSEGQVGRDYDTLMMGHWHQTLWLPGVIVNNCLKGYDEFARLALRAPAGPASQTMFFVHPKYGINTMMDVYVQDPRAFRCAGNKKRKGDPKWVEIFQK